MLFAAFLVVVIGLALLSTRGFTVRAGLFPWAVGFPLLGVLILQLITDFRGKAVKPAEDDEETEIPRETANRRTRNMFFWILAYFVAIWLLGFSIGGTLCAFLHLKFASREKWPITIILVVGIGAFVYLFFERTLNVPFPPGYAFELLGWAE